MKHCNKNNSFEQKNQPIKKLFKDCDLSDCFSLEHSEAIRHIVREITVSKSMFKSTIIEALQTKITF